MWLVTFPHAARADDSVPKFLAGAAVALGAWFIWMAVALARHISPRGASLLFHMSLLYLALLFVAAAADSVV